MSESEALRDRLTAELEAAIAAAIEAAARDRHRPIAEVGPTDATGLLVSVARVAHFNREYDAGARTVAKLTLPKRWPLPTAERMARWLLKYPENLTLASAVAEAAMLTPADAHTEHERNAHRAAERWLRDFREPYALGAGGAPGYWTPDRWLSFAVLFLSDLVVAYLATKRQRQPLYDLVAAWQRCPAKSLFETRNFRPEVLATATDVGQATATDVGQVSSLYLMSEEFMLVAKSELKNSVFLTAGEDQIQRRYLLSWPRTGVNVQASLVERRRRLPQGAWIRSVTRLHDQGRQGCHSSDSKRCRLGFV